ncbi:MAG: hypothetical protein ACRD16_11845 [Thermoanaerobaculia bacterium]
MIGSFVLTVDVEPDERLLDPARRPEWNGFLDMLQEIGPLRERLSRRTGRRVFFNWFLRMDHQIAEVYGNVAWAARHYRDVLAKLESEGDAIGLHHHAFRWCASNGRWVSDHEDEPWIERSVTNAVEGFLRQQGCRPRAFRFGDRWLSDRLVARLDRLGIRYDLTLEPGMRSASGMVPTESSRGLLPDSQTALRRPYRPARSNYREPGGVLRRRLWLIPVSTGCVNGPALPAQVRPEHDFVHLNLGLDPGWIRHILDGLLDAEEPIVVSVARTGDLTLPGGRDRFLENLDFLCRHARVAERIFETAAAAIARFRKHALRKKSEG